MSFDTSGNGAYSTEVGIAGAGGTQALATAITKQFNVVSTLTVTSADGVSLPKAVTGRKVTIRNNHASVALEVWPAYDSVAAAASGDTIEGGTANAEAVAPILAGDSMTYLAISGSEATAAAAAVAGDWVSISDAGVIV